jgi:hypothetical protein
MIRRRAIALLILLLGCKASGQTDSGKDVIGMVTVTVYHATNGDPAAAGARAKEVTAEVAARLSSDERLKFSKYLELGRDVKPLFRSDDSWAQPLPPSDEILLCFEAQSKASKESMRVDIELWLSRKKVLKTVVSMEAEKPLLVLGPEWRGGRLIVALELAPGRPKKP